MKIAMTTRERAAVAAVMHRSQWGGGQEALLAQAAIYEGLQLAAFVGREGARLTASEHIDRKAYDLPDDAREAFAGILTVSGISWEIGLLNVGVLRRLPPPPAPAPAEPSTEAETSETSAAAPPASPALASVPPEPTEEKGNVA
jgi:hypothetical protein